ncbi:MULTISPECIES: dihydroxyacetone kinase subunit DhaL [Actinoalloteichus]|uniref:Dihydroxyacetone kinase, phosphoprotein-dependent, L subunit n=1 Tax=Actinoalloteichus fjordicus TaxID=1612552 RepID=A0AAC9L9M9_9PSEU|nr:MULTISPECIES: dihydroxyacetone kinase subunit DhaL [Actinoalloteichus]APU13501.1 dihydroxyacetone kinase, phosphoprotein-dependent, L subunit [Actinoalloteichus fjordicus]APU19450.1 dihydroxyacetone kinase, phosphoprotein-dependent, L subunit [Actinoalloteichus sp. GBA129-24]
MSCDGAGTAAAWLRVAEVVREHRDELVMLDREIGDGDHGENLRRGFDMVADRLTSAEDDTPRAVLRLVASTLISTVGGAAGPLYGTALLRAGNAIGDRPVLDAAAVAAALTAAVEGVVARGRAEPGDKTMVDALQPAASAAVAASERGATIAEVLAEASAAADAGAHATVPLIARKGRASYLGERSAGHLDPGARSTALILASLAASAASWRPAGQAEGTDQGGPTGPSIAPGEDA